MKKSPPSISTFPRVYKRDDEQMGFQNSTLPKNNKVVNSAHSLSPSPSSVSSQTSPPDNNEVVPEVTRFIMMHTFHVYLFLRTISMFLTFLVQIHHEFHFTFGLNILSLFWLQSDT